MLACLAFPHIDIDITHNNQSMETIVIKIESRFTMVGMSGDSSPRHILELNWRPSNQTGQQTATHLIRMFKLIWDRVGSCDINNVVFCDACMSDLPFKESCAKILFGNLFMVLFMLNERYKNLYLFRMHSLRCLPWVERMV